MDDRTLIAAIAMGGMLASQNKDTLETITDDAVIAADMLLKALRDSGRSLAQRRTTGSVKWQDSIFLAEQMSARANRRASGH